MMGLTKRWSSWRPLYKVAAFIMLVLGLSTSLSPMFSQEVQAASGTYLLECDNNGLNGIYLDTEYIIFYRAPGVDSSKWSAMDHAVVRIKNDAMNQYNNISINGGQTNHKCYKNNDNYSEFTSLDSALEFVKWAETDQYTTKPLEWLSKPNGDGGALNAAYLNMQTAGGLAPGTIPSSVDDWNKIGMVVCRWASDDAVLGYKHLVQFYDRSGKEVTALQSKDTHNSCSNYLKNELQGSTSPAKNWPRKDSEGMTYMYNPNGYTDAWAARTDIKTTKTTCELSANPQIDDAVTSCRITVSGDKLVNAYVYGTWSGFKLKRVNGTTYDIVADTDSVKEVGDEFVVMFWRAGSKQPTKGDQYYEVGKDLLKVTVKRIENTGEVNTDWKAEVHFYNDCDGWDFRSSTNKDYCVVLSGDGMKRSGGSLHKVFVTVLESNDAKHPVGSQNFTVQKASEKYWFEVSDYSTVKLKVKFCLDNDAGNPSADCRTVTIGESHTVMPDPETGNCPDGWTKTESGECQNTQAPVDPEEPGEEEVTCFNGGGALGWILCPILEGSAKAVRWAYETIIEPFLNIDARLFNNEGGGDAVFNAWSIFQGFANIAFIILLLVVIFSQLTGVGIDNYGIKKILPKLIITAVLINLSYVICQLAVDLSNVLGYSIRSLFEGIAAGVSIPPGTFAPDMSGAATFFTGVIAALMAALGVIAIISNGLAILLPLILAMISGLIAVFFLFVLLGVRQAGVVLLVVISPLAFVCYMLPNTKKLFDRWLKMLQGLLIFFPICGLLIGAGELASKILLSTGTDSFFMALTAMLLNVVPFFFLPMLLKASFAAMGNIGAKISGIGSKIGKGAAGKVENSNLYKDGKARLAAGRAGGLRERMANSRVGRATGVQRRMAQNRAAYLKQGREDAAANNLMGAGYLAAQAKQTTDVEREDLDNQIALVNRDTNKGEDQDALMAEYDAAVESGNTVRARAVAEIAGRRKDTAAAFTRHLKDQMSGQNDFYNTDARRETLRAVSKQISTGENSKQYRSADALGFEFASQYNRGATDARYEDWTADRQNVRQTMDNHITNAQELSGQSRGTLNELANLTAGNAQDAGYLNTLATRAQEEAVQTGVYDQTKDNAMARLQGYGTAANNYADAGQLREADQAATRAAGQARQDAVFDVQRQTLQATHEQAALARGTEQIRIGGTTGGSTVTGFMPPSNAGFDLSDTSRVSGGVITPGSTRPSDRIITSADGSKRWNITRGRYEN